MTALTVRFSVRFYSKARSAGKTRTRSRRGQAALRLRTHIQAFWPATRRRDPQARLQQGYHL